MEDLNKVPRFKDDSKRRVSRKLDVCPRPLPEFYRSYKEQKTQYNLGTFLKSMKRGVETVAGDEDASSTVDISLSDQIQLANKGEEITPDLGQQQRLYAIQQKAI